MTVLNDLEQFHTINVRQLNITKDLIDIQVFIHIQINLF